MFLLWYSDSVRKKNLCQEIIKQMFWLNQKWLSAWTQVNFFKQLQSLEYTHIITHHVANNMAKPISVILWKLTEEETFASYRGWQQNMLYCLNQDATNKSLLLSQWKKTYLK